MSGGEWSALVAKATKSLISELDAATGRLTTGSVKSLVSYFSAYARCGSVSWSGLRSLGWPTHRT
jgi:hypothetical protein